MKKEILIVGIIFLFIGVSIAPSITANNALIKNKMQIAPEKETVSFTVEVCGLNGEKQTVELTKEEAEEVEQLLNSIRERLNNTETREETEEVFKEAVIELDKYGLLGDLSIKQAQKLVIGNIGFNNYEKSKLKNNNIGLDENENMFCLIAGDTTETLSVGLGTIMSGTLCLLLLLLSLSLKIQILAHLAQILFYTSLLLLFSPLKLGGFMTFGFSFDWPPPPEYHPAKGWVYTIGLNGVKIWNSPIYGGIFDISNPYDTHYLGATGFTGIKISPLGSGFYFGSALRVKLSNEDPTQRFD